MRGAFCSVHTHSRMCDGKNTLAEMARAAFEAGAVSFGASGHSHTPLPEDEGEVLPADMTAYRAEVLRLREEYAGRMDVLLGIELDNLADVTAEGFDYWIGSAHHMRDPEGGWHAVDWDRETLERCFREDFSGRSRMMAESYYDEVRRMALEALHAADPKETLLEINTGAMSRGYRSVPYPALFLLKEWRAMGGKIILTADAHSADAIVYGYAQAAELGRAAGFARSVLPVLAGREERPLDI